MTEEFARQRLEESACLLAQAASLAGVATEAARFVTRALAAGGKVLACGNGGSAAQAQHFCGELVGRYLRPRGALPALALNADCATLTALANDFGFEEAFARQVEGLGREGDVLVALSTSGMSPNVAGAARAARRRGVVVIALTGAVPGMVGAEADLCLAAPSRSTPRIQEAHLVLLHLIAELVELEVAGP